jgi:hypothetical protein
MSTPGGVVSISTLTSSSVIVAVFGNSNSYKTDDGKGKEQFKLHFENTKQLLVSIYYCTVLSLFHNTGDVVRFPRKCVRETSSPLHYT